MTLSARWCKFAGTVLLCAALLCAAACQAGPSPAEGEAVVWYRNQDVVMPMTLGSVTRVRAYHVHGELYQLVVDQQDALTPQVFTPFEIVRYEAGEGVPIYLHTDASQAAGALSVNVSTLGVDLLTLSAAKIYGPKQVGLLWASDDVRLRPLVYGGGQEAGVRSGTENVAGIVGFARALELACERRGEEVRRLGALRERLREALPAELPWMVVSGPRNAKRRLPGLLHVSFAGIEARRLVIALEREGVSVGTGSACAASRMRVSHVLEAIGMPRPLAEGSLRLTLGRPTTDEDVDYAVGAIVRAVRAEMVRLGLDDAAQAARMAALLGGADGPIPHNPQNRLENKA